MNDINIGDWVYGEDWCYGQVIDINDEGALVEYETPGGGSMRFYFNELEKARAPEANGLNEPVNNETFALDPETASLNIVLHTNEVSDPDATLAEIFKHISQIKDRMVNLSIM